eukprot:6464535-Amphidinium_carterae.1
MPTVQHMALNVYTQMFRSAFFRPLCSLAASCWLLLAGCGLLLLGPAVVDAVAGLLLGLAVVAVVDVAA